MEPRRLTQCYADPDPMITIEFAEPKVSSCDCCGGTTTRLTRFVYRDGDAYAVYYAAFSDNHPDHYVSLIVSIGEWADDAPPSLRVAVPMRLWAGEDDFNVTVTDASESPWHDAEILGRVLDREEALAHPRIKEVFHITDHIFAEDAPVKQYLEKAA
jgi:hypothetical protein